MDLTKELNKTLRDRINLDCDWMEFKGDAIFFYFSRHRWKTVFMDRPTVKAAVIRAYMLGFRQFIFVRYDGLQFPTTYRHWIPRDRGILRGRSR